MELMYILLAIVAILFLYVMYKILSSKKGPQPPVSPPAKPLRIYGSMTLPDEHDDSGITVRLYRTNSNELIGTTITDSVGFFEFTNLSPGTYEILAHKDQLKFVSGGFSAYGDEWNITGELE